MKKIKIILTLITFILSIFSHFIYEIFPNFITSILFPVNESIWEHMKLIATPILITSIFEYLYYKRKNIPNNNFLLSKGISIILGIIFYLIIYLPIDKLIGHNIFIAILFLFITFILIEYISYHIINLNSLKYNKITSIFLLINIYLIFYYFTYYPKEINIFYDHTKNIYGINNTNPN